ncbi:protein disulfide isomerase-like 1-3 isoform X2 [Beta vulgaris subsp. vulgaris]|uniref:protein disulfide isomerase-like 1-3 isoform X2 n=1 Tax=Beta vulgaris subsp. vulgaris TaxID=3555 RepID=UPI0020376563|nr:protein disulfide isomerase-like 1-3 isoform X2 [Beta vulgaris subsp. vulgaris]
MATLKTLLLLLLPLLVLATTVSIVATANDTTKTVTTSTTVDIDGDEDLSFLDEPKAPKDYPDYADPNYRPQGDDIDYKSFEDFQQWDESKAPPAPVIKEKDVVVLNKTNFDEFISNTKNIMVQFYAPWCGYCKKLVPEYAAAATELKEGGFDVVLAKVDAIQETELADKYKVDGFPALFFFTDGAIKSYEGDRTRDAIVSWLKKKTGHAVYNVTSTEEAEDIFLAETKLVVAYVDSLTGSDSEVLDAAAKQEDDVNFYQTTSSDVAKVFQIDTDAKRPAVVLLKKEIEKLSKFDGDFSKSAIVDFVSSNKHPLVITFTMESASFVFEGPIQNQLFLFSPAQQSEKLIPTLVEAAKAFKGKIIFSYVQMENKDYGKPMIDFFGVDGDAPRVLAYTGHADRRKFFMEGDITSDNIKSFAEDFLADKLKPFYKSDLIPETNEGDVKIVVGKNFEEIVLDESKDVLLEIYAPWCSHCQALEPSYNRLAKHLRGVESLVVAKMDGTKNEHPKALVQGFPTILFYPAGNESSDPIIFDSDSVTGVALYKFIKKHATTPFKIEKPIDPPSLTSEGGEPVTIETEAANDSPNVKDEL